MVDGRYLNLPSRMNLMSRCSVYCLQIAYSCQLLQALHRSSVILSWGSLHLVTERDRDTETHSSSLVGHILMDNTYLRALICDWFALQFNCLLSPILLHPPFSSQVAILSKHLVPEILCSKLAPKNATCNSIETGRLVWVRILPGFLKCKESEDPCDMIGMG
jgi:hypothetical protein